MAKGIVGSTLFIDLIGRKYNRLTVVARAPNKYGRTAWECQCECGKVLVVTGNALRENNTRSCGCFKLQRSSESHRTHGMSKSRTYFSWCSMKDRCCNPNNEDFHHYGGRGIKVCERWLHSFEAFLEDMGEKPPRTSIERKNVNGNYEPGNCRWATQREQTRNKRTNHLITFNGQTKTLMEWSEITGIDYRLIRKRIVEFEWPVEKALDPTKRSRWDKNL